MKTVSGRVEASKPVSLSKAARILSKFVSSDNGASPAVAAYLKRASASFDELVQLRKELKGSGSGSGSDYKGKKKHVPDGVVTKETVNSVVKKPSQDDFLTEEKLGASDRKKQNSEGNVGRNSAVVEKKLKKKKKEGGEIELITDKDQTCSDLDAMAVNGVNDAVESLDGVKETKKKKKRDKGDGEQSDGAMKIQKKEQSFPLSEDHANGEATDVLENGESERKKHKKNEKGKEEKESSDITSTERTDPSDGGNENNKVKTEGGEGKKQKKKRNREGEEREIEGKVEIEEADTKESRKRKHKASDHEGFYGSEERHRSKKKTRRNEVDD